VLGEHPGEHDEPVVSAALRDPAWQVRTAASWAMPQR
jgi:hypothetical protein